MVKLDIEQGSDEWFAARLGIPTSSNFDKIITPTGKPSAQAEEYRNVLLAEYTGGTKKRFCSDHMKNGTELEPEARRYYEFTNDVKVEQIGLVYKNSKRLVSCSPDGLLQKGGLEIKCPMEHTHIGYLLGGALPKKYKQQVQGSMYVTGYRWWDFMSYHINQPPLIVRIERDDEYIKLMHKCMTSFIADLVKCRQTLNALNQSEIAA